MACPTELYIIRQFEGKRTDNDEREEDFYMCILRERPSEVCENDILFDGIVTDDFGMSLVSGKRDNTHMFFSQRYSENAADCGAYEEPITYSGTLNGNRCEGEYHKKDDPLNKLGAFSMEMK